MESKTKCPGYAARLSECEDKGIVGLAEIQDRNRQRDGKLAKLLKLLKASQNTVVMTGAGISTNAGIADFRGPNGVWTKEKKTKKLKRAMEFNDDDSFEHAQPTRTHVILTSLCKQGLISGVISQNVDGLHLRSGFPKQQLVELHGNVFLERCPTCKFEIFHDKDMGGVGCKPTQTPCPQCALPPPVRRSSSRHTQRSVVVERVMMHDTVLDWDTPIDEDLWKTAETWIHRAQVVLCLGTSLRIVPAASLPLLNPEATLVIVNLQPTPLDAQCALKIHCDVDVVLEYLNENL